MLNVRHGTRDWKTASTHRREFLPCPEPIAGEGDPPDSFLGITCRRN